MKGRRKGEKKKENFYFSKLCCWTMEERDGRWIKVKTKLIMRQSNFRVSIANLTWEKSKCKIPKPNNKQLPLVYVYKISVVKSSLWSLEPGVIKLDRKSIYFPHSNEGFLLEWMKVSREAENLSVPLYIWGFFFFFSLEEAQQRGLGMLHQGHSSNSKKTNEPVVNRIILQKDGSCPDAFLKLL